VEYAQIFARFGANVTMIVRGGPVSFLKQMACSIAQAVSASLERAGVRVLYHALPEAVELAADGLSAIVNLGEGRSLRAETFLSATRSEPVISGLGLEHLGVDLEPGYRSGAFDIDPASCGVHSRLDAAAGRIFAIGDVAGPPALASTAVYQAQAAAAAINPQCRMGRPAPLERQVFGTAIWTLPEMAYVGVTEEQAASTSGTRASALPRPALPPR
jgi:pyruvate/2-oxoglutarate dehydrogenase complex dihydrolipoamide dehydrogenase (E3) component